MKRIREGQMTRRYPWNCMKSARSFKYHTIEVSVKRSYSVSISLENYCLLKLNFLKKGTSYFNIFKKHFIEI